MKVSNKDVFREPFVLYNVNLETDVFTPYLESFGLYTFEGPVFSFNYRVPLISIDCSYKYHFVIINGILSSQGIFLNFDLLFDFVNIRDNFSYFFVLHYKDLHYTYSPYADLGYPDMDLYRVYIFYYRKVDLLFTKEVYFMEEKVRKICIDVDKYFDVFRVTVKNGEIYIERIKSLILFPFNALFHINLPDKVVFSDIYFFMHFTYDVNRFLYSFIDTSDLFRNKHYFINKSTYLSNYVGNFCGLVV